MTTIIRNRPLSPYYNDFFSGNSFLRGGADTLALTASEFYIKVMEAMILDGARMEGKSRRIELAPTSRGISTATATLHKKNGSQGDACRP